METINILNKTFKIYITAEQIEKRISTLAREIENQLTPDTIIISVLNGSILFTSDLIRTFKNQYQIDFIRLSSYQNTASSGKVQEVLGLQQSIANKNILIIEDIVDTGTTIDYLSNYLFEQGANTIKTASLLHKAEIQEKGNPPDFVGFSIPSAFVIGYGLDFNGLGRGLSNIYQLHLD